MGKLEAEHRRKIRRANLKKIILGVVATAGVLGVAAIAPNALGAMARLGMIPVKRQKEFIINSRNRLIRRGLLAYQNGLLQLTPEGERILRALEIRDFSLRKPKRWDGKWRMLIFDIAEKKKRVREQIRHSLFQIGFVRVQDSVWLFPYDCEDVITLLKADFHLGKEVLYVITDAIENDSVFRRHFSIHA
ncbi:MAG: hypothetical protein HY434_01970 [Candidatus Liptonbacteria bacterium]|nr:hypothetical protein [Candidatus Niyogibacteria bacterium]MBI4087574.1 hypothetical protein [Candidatus Liptonbacteria bacterium]